MVARELGKTFEEITRIDTWELAHWIALLKIDPLDRDRNETMLAQLSAMQAANAKPKDFIIDYEAQARPRDKRRAYETAKARFMAWAQR